MDEGTGHREFNLERVIAEVESDPRSPSIRAHEILNDLARMNKYTNLDALCFSVEYIAGLVAVAPWLEVPARDLIRLLYIAMYVRKEGTEWLKDTPVTGSVRESPTTE